MLHFRRTGFLPATGQLCHDRGTTATTPGGRGLRFAGIRSGRRGRCFPQPVAQQRQFQFPISVDSDANGGGDLPAVQVYVYKGRRGSTDGPVGCRRRKAATA